MTVHHSRVALNPTTLRILASGGVLTWIGTYIEGCETNTVKGFQQQKEYKCYDGLWHCSGSVNFSQFQIRNVLRGDLYSWCKDAVAPNRTFSEAKNEFDVDGHMDGVNTTPQDVETKRVTMEYDFVVIGNGNAGQSAVKELRSICPNATIAVIDPFRHPNIEKTNAGNSNSTRSVEYYSQTVARFHPPARSVQLIEDTTTEIRYKHGILVATGARGAPPPLELLEDRALPQILELRTTELSGNTKRPSMAPETVREKILQAVSSKRGAKVGILGSGWEALDLVNAINQSQRHGNKKQRPSLFFGSPGPVWNRLPPYLSAEIRKKLGKRGIEFHDRSVVRYVSLTTSSTKNNEDSNNRSRGPKLELHTAKSYDLLESQRTELDLLVVAPDTSGAKGTAALPTLETPERMKESSDGRPWYKTWSQLTKPSPSDPSVIVCFEDDGRIAVNAELSVASRVYAAGSVARYPNSSTGNASVAGEGPIDGSEAGRIAARNMSREYLMYNSNKSSTSILKSMSEDTHEDYESLSFAATSFPVWRSDLTSYKSKDRAPVPSALLEFGIQALCVGNCDSERQYTRGFWWTNSSAQRRTDRQMESKILEGQQDTTSSSEAIAQRRRTQQRRNTARIRRKLGIVAPIYGIGIVYYLDNVGRIQGIMTWGLPFVSCAKNHTPEEVEGELNAKLVDRMKHVIRTNGGVSAIDSEENQQIMNAFLARESQRLVSLAMEGYAPEFEKGRTSFSPHGLGGPIVGYSRPLYRYTEPTKTSSNYNISVLKRKDGNNLGILGEDLYVRDEFVVEGDFEGNISVEMDKDEEVPIRNLPSTLYPINIAPMRTVATTAAKSGRSSSPETFVEINRFLAIQRGWEDNDNRARPGKEDLLWLRPGDEQKSVSQRQLMIDRYRSILFPGR